MKKINDFSEFQINGLELINVRGSLMAGTCTLTKCSPCPDDPCHDCCEDEKDDPAQMY